MQTIFKYPLKDTNIIHEMELWSGSTMLSVIEQDRQIMVYALTDPKEAEKGNTKKFTFQVIGTGWDLPANGIDLTGYGFLGTVKVGLYVWHVFWK